MVSKWFRTEWIKGLDLIFAHSKHNAAEISDERKKFSSKSTSSAEWEIAKCVAMHSNWLASLCESSPVMFFPSVLSMSAAAAGTAPPASSDSTFK